MKKITGTIIMVSIGLCAFCQTVVGQEASANYNKEFKQQVLTNRFWSNWFIGAGAGVQTYFGDHNRQMSLSETITPVYGAHLGKWFSPGIGVRAGASLGDFKGATQNGSHSTGEIFDASQNLKYQKYSYHHIYGDVLFNLTNIFGGYRESRFYTISPFVGLGWMVTKDAPEAKEVSANIGFLNTFKLAKSLDLTLDVRGAMVNDRFDGELGKRRQEGSLSAMLGLSYKFNKRNWDEPVATQVVVDNSAELGALKDKVSQLSSQNDALLKQLADAKGKSITDIKVENRVLAAPILVTFPINKSIVSNEARVNLGFFAQVIKEGDANVVYNVTGYADKGTGTPKINEKLSRDRAAAIKSILVNEFGVSESQLNVNHEGGVDNMFYNDPRVSRAVITRAQ